MPGGSWDAPSERPGTRSAAPADDATLADATAGWPAVAQARRGDPRSRVPLHVAGRLAGSVARRHLVPLGEVAASATVPGVAWRIGDAGVTLEINGTDAGTPACPAGALPDPVRVEAAFDALNNALRATGLITGWREERYLVTCLDTRIVLGRLERAAARFWGTLTLGAHANGWVAGADGRPEALWIAQRSLTKATDPGLFDNLIGGGVPADQSPWEALQREGWEEAGLGPELLLTARAGRIWRLERELPEGWQVEELHVHDLQLPANTVPVNQDGEVARFDRLPVAQALALARSGRMTVDASLATLDFALRHGLLGPQGAALSAAASHLWRAPL